MMILELLTGKQKKKYVKQQPYNFSSLLARETVLSSHSSAEPPREKGESTLFFYLRKWRPWKSSHLSKATHL